MLARGLPASPGAVAGEAVFSADEAVAVTQAGRKVILVRIETSPEDIHGMQVAEGILTARGGMTSHAAVVARGMGKCCVAGCSEIEINYAAGTLSAAGKVIHRGEYLTLDGTAGEVIEGRVPTVEPVMSPFFKKFLGWADAERRLGVRANADTPHDAKTAREFGAEGIGLCRTEHMFFAPERIEAVREMILAENGEQRARALAKILPMQREDFVGILREMKGLPVTIRLLDPPLHEFLPREEAEIRELAAKIGVTTDHLKQVRDNLFEFNPMLGHRGSRLGISYPEIYKAQVRAILEAATQLHSEGVRVIPEIMLPLIGERREYEILASEIREVAKQLGTRVKYSIGTMIEVPRACIEAGEIGAVAEFFSFGTNDLTQMAYGLSRDDSGKFLGDYIERGIYKSDPFAQLDPDGVGGLMRIAIERGRKANPKLKLGICGEHGGDPESVKLLPSPRARLRFVFAISGSDRSPGRRAGRNRGTSHQARFQGCLAKGGCGGSWPPLAQVVFDANRRDRNLADPIVAQNLQLDDLARVMTVNRVVQRAPVVDLVFVGGQHHVALLEAGLLARAPRHHARDHHVLPQRVRHYAQPQPRRHADAAAVAHQFIAAQDETFAGNGQDRAGLDRRSSDTRLRRSVRASCKSVRR